MLTHQNLVANIAGMETFDGNLFGIHDDDVYLSYLPLAHVVERCFMLCAMTYRMQYGFYQGDVQKIKEDLAELSPTVFCSVPRLYNRFYDVMQKGISELTGAKKYLVDRAIAAKMYYLATEGALTHRFYDALVFNKFKQALGGRVRLMVSGSAPINPEIVNFLKIAFGCQLHECYGQTESAAPLTCSSTLSKTSGHVGGPYSTCDLKLVDVPEMAYTSEDVDENGVPIPRGEVCFRGFNCFKGYYKMPKETKDTIDMDGWVHTGDIGMFLPDGTLKIIDRKKNIFKLSQGEYIIPEKVEQALTGSTLISQAFVYGDSFQHFLVAILVPEFSHLNKWAANNGLPTDNQAALLANEATIQLF